MKVHFGEQKRNHKGLKVNISDSENLGGSFYSITAEADQLYDARYKVEQR